MHKFRGETRNANTFSSEGFEEVGEGGRTKRAVSIGNEVGAGQGLHGE